MRAEGADGRSRSTVRAASLAADGLAVNARSRREDLEVGSLVLAALSALAARRIGATDAAFEQRVESLCGALTHIEAGRARIQASKMLACGIAAEELVDRYAPAAARRLGERWVADRLSFAEVSIAAARLQELVRGLDGAARYAGGAPLGPCALGRSVLMLTPEPEQHTLGAFVAADRLRRLGFWTHVSVGLSPGEAADLVATQGFSAVGVSSSSRRLMDPVRKLIESIRACADFTGVIGVGGFITALGDEVGRYTGADILTPDPARLAALCDDPAPAACAARRASTLGAPLG